MTENYSGNIKIREKPSMHKRHNFLFSKNFPIENFLGKKQSSKKITTFSKKVVIFFIAAMVFKMSCMPAVVFLFLAVCLSGDYNKRF